VTGSHDRDSGLAGRVARYLCERPPVTVEDPERSQAAVAVVVAPDPASLLFIRRATRAGDPWSGQMALPGGRMEPADADLRVTAMRETMEEVAISLETAEALGTLDDVAPRTPYLPPITVRPYVFAIHEAVPPPPRPCRDEVADAFWLTIDDLVRPGTYGTVTVDFRGTGRVFPAYAVGDHVVWGMTERILTPLLRGLQLIP